ncbi:MAG: trypsin-like peptidase domain-containing protein [Bacteroides sp.]|nr:trypsin-like peptidase domain-containing protein [Bacteroides sp.]
MYENNGYQPPYNFTTDPNGQYGQYPNQEPPKPPKKKKTSTGLIVGVIAAAVVFGSVSGFGGSYLASRIDGGSPAYNEHKTPGDAPAPGTSDEGDVSDVPVETPATTPEYVKPEVEVSDDLSSLENMANINTTRLYSYEDLFDKVSESVVVVNNYILNNGYSDADTDYVKYGTGSGVIFTTDGYIITNYHVVDSADKVSIIITDKYSDEEEIEAVLVGSDSATDLAVLKVSREQMFTAAPLGDSDSLRIGQDVAAIGNPAGLNNSFTRGIISGLNRYASEKGYELSSIQTDAAINPGNSGGGLFDMYGNVIGIVNSKLVAEDSSIENLGFAITINEAKPVISDLINYGYVTGRPALGITTLQVNQYTAQIYGLSAAGLLVTDINRDAPVASSGLQIGDVIIKVNGTQVSSVTDVQTITKGMSAGDKITVTVSRASSDGNGYFGSKIRSQTLDFEVILTENK